MVSRVNNLICVGESRETVPPVAETTFAWVRRFFLCPANSLVFLVLSGCLLGVCFSGAIAGGTVYDVRVGEHPDKTRVVLDLSEALAFAIFTLRDPYRVVVDLPSVSWTIGAGGSISTGLIEDYRFGQFQPGTSRLVLDVTHPVGIRKAFLLPPSGTSSHRLVIDLEAISETEFTARSQSTTAPEPEPAKPAPLIEPKGADEPRVIVIDPGHGGIDPGAIGATGIYEKDIVLAAAFELKRQLESGGRYQVVMTRESDNFLPLRSRVAVARDMLGDLFVSLHADSIGNKGVRGASVYTLSEKASDKEAAALASRENKSDIIAGLDLSEHYDAEVAAILITLTQRETMNCSATFAALLVQELAKNAKTLANAHRSAGFRVLKAPDVPSILIEMGYLSNKKDEAFLDSDAGRRTLMESVVRAIDAYFRKNSCWT